jgi:hypothetical protein
MVEREQTASAIVLPTEVAPPLRIIPENLIIFGLPKCGKTTELAKLPNHLLIDVERGSKYVACN